MAGVDWDKWWDLNKRQAAGLFYGVLVIVVLFVLTGIPGCVFITLMEWLVD